MEKILFDFPEITKKLKQSSVTVGKGREGELIPWVEI